MNNYCPSQVLKPKLSICISTYNRGAFIGATLDSILSQIPHGVELVVVDGASPDMTPEVMSRYATAHPEIRYFRESVNSGLDEDYDKAVGYARGEYCWLMTDDDLLKTGALTRVLAVLDGGGEELVIVNSEVRNADLSDVLEARMLRFDTDREYREAGREAFFAETASYLSFIGCVVIRREIWLARERSIYYGSLFLHVGVIFQSPPVTNVRVIAEPLITIRYGNAMWTPQRFEIWMYKWPQLVWAFPDFTDYVKRKVCRRNPSRSAKALFYYRALGAYSTAEYSKYLSHEGSLFNRQIAFLVSVFPASLANVLLLIYFLTKARPALLGAYDLLNSRNAGFLTRLVSYIYGKRKL